VTSIFTTQSDSNFVHILITPGQVTNSTGLFQGMSMLNIGEVNFSDYISDNQKVLHGGFGDLFAFLGFGDSTPSFDLTYGLQYSPPASSSFGFSGGNTHFTTTILQSRSRNMIFHNTTS